MLLHHFCQPSFYNGSCPGEPFSGFLVSVSRASSSQNFEPALRPPSSRFSRRSRADPAAHFSSISCGKCSSPCCGNFRKISAEILREIRRNFQHEVFENFRKKKQKKIGFGWGGAAPQTSRFLAEGGKAPPDSPP